jgi:biopolymer transport protein ExbB
MIGLLGTVIGMMGAFAVLGQTGVSDPRKLAMSIGEVLLATASGLFIAIPAFIFYYFFRNRINDAAVYADGELSKLVQDIPFDEVKGMRIGEDFSAGDGLTAGSPQSKVSHKVSMQLTTNCPVCQTSIVPGQNPCPGCGTTLDWQS